MPSTAARVCQQRKSQLFKLGAVLEPSVLVTAAAAELSQSLQLVAVCLAVEHYRGQRCKQLHPPEWRLHPSG